MMSTVLKSDSNTDRILVSGSVLELCVERTETDFVSVYSNPGIPLFLAIWPARETP